MKLLGKLSKLFGKNSRKTAGERKVRYQVVAKRVPMPANSVMDVLKLSPVIPDIETLYITVEREFKRKEKVKA